MTWYNSKWISLIFISWFRFSIHCHIYALCMLSIQVYINCIIYEPGYIRSCVKYPSRGFFIGWWDVHSWFMDLDNLSKVIVHYHLNWGITCLDYQDKFLIRSALVCMVTHWIKRIMNHDISNQVIIVGSFMPSRPEILYARATRPNKPSH